jgi:LmbE family N-acetylglucosaminyl deacetylase
MNILAIGAHFDDVELGCGGALARHAKGGDNVFVYVATTSGFANQYQETVRSDESALAEARQALGVLGITELFCGSFKTFDVEFTDALSIDILRIVEENQVNRVYTHWFGDTHHDHQAVSKASIHCCRRVPCVLMYRSNWYHSPVAFREDFYIDITEYWPIKERALKAYASEMERTGNAWLRFFENEAENAGRRVGVKYAEGYELIKWLE